MLKKGKMKSQGNVISDFFDKNKSLKILLPLMVVAIIAVIIVYSSLGYNSKPASTQLNPPKNSDLSGQKVDVLPQIERAKVHEVDNNLKDPFSSGHISTIALKGTILYENKSTAILETQESSYIVGEGDSVEGWTIKSIETDNVILVSAEGNEFVLKYDE